MFERKSGLPAYPTFDTFTSRTYQYKERSFGYDYNLNDDSSSLLYIPTRNDPLVCYSSGCGSEGSADALAREEAVLNLLYNVFGLEKGQVPAVHKLWPSCGTKMQPESVERNQAQE